jgi:hypothetical protein
MEAAFGVIIVVVLVIGIGAALYAGFTSGDAYGQIGKGAFSLRDGTDRPAREPTAALAAGQREDEIRQMLEARNDRRVARGEQARDIEEELAELLRPAHDPTLEAEVRQLVIARNERRERQGKPPLDVEEEVARQLRELS